jgi:hypothetical protein
MNKEEVVQSEILDKCLTLIQSGEMSIADCLEAYPEHSAFLEPLFSTAHEVRVAFSPNSPPKAFINTTKIRVLNQLQMLQGKTLKLSGNLRKRGFLKHRPAFAFLSLALVFILLFSGIGLSNASAEALPGDTLYGVKRGVEELRLLLSFSPNGDAELLSEFSDARLSEIEELISTDTLINLDLALVEYEQMLSRLLDVVEDEEIMNDVDMLDKIHGGITNHEEVLQRVMEKAPPSAQKGLVNALEHSNNGKETIKHIREEGHPRDSAPGQQKKDSKGRGKP